MYKVPGSNSTQSSKDFLTFGETLYFFYFFKLLFFPQKYTASQTHFGFTNTRSNMHRFSSTAISFWLFSNGTPCISKKNVVSQAEKGWSSNFKKERCLHSLKKCKDDLDAIIIHETPHWVSGNIFSKSKLSGCVVHFQCFICWASTFYRKVITIERLISQKSKSADTDYRQKLPIKSAD